VAGMGRPCKRSCLPPARSGSPGPASESRAGPRPDSLDRPVARVARQGSQPPPMPSGGSAGRAGHAAISETDPVGESGASQRMVGLQGDEMTGCGVPPTSPQRGAEAALSLLLFLFLLLPGVRENGEKE